MAATEESADVRRFVRSLFADRDLRQEFRENPAALLEERGLSGVSVTEFRDALRDLSDRVPMDVAERFGPVLSHLDDVVAGNDGAEKPVEAPGPAAGAGPEIPAAPAPIDPVLPGERTSSPDDPTALAPTPEVGMIADPAPGADLPGDLATGGFTGARDVLGQPGDNAAGEAAAGVGDLAGELGLDPDLGVDAAAIGEAVLGGDLGGAAEEAARAAAGEVADELGVPGEVLGVGEKLAEGDAEGAAEEAARAAAQAAAEELGVPGGAVDVGEGLLSGDGVSAEDAALLAAEIAAEAAGVGGYVRAGEDLIEGDYTQAYFGTVGTTIGELFGPAGGTVGGLIGKGFGEVLDYFGANDAIDAGATLVFDWGTEAAEDLVTDPFGTTEMAVTDTVDFVLDAPALVLDTAGDVLDTAGGVAEDVGGAIGDAGEAAGDAAGDALAAVGDAAGDVAEGAGGVVEDAGGVVSDVGDALDDLF
ncbi:MAG TPA: hypothetical protein VEO00_01415 [Actinomycetota bacterium]|nr:hypothetical protein [Actinomycetota bacterium]